MLRINTESDRFVLMYLCRIPVLLSETLIVSNLRSYFITRIEVNLKQLAINRQKNTRSYFMNTNVTNQHERDQRLEDD